MSNRIILPLVLAATVLVRPAIPAAAPPDQVAVAVDQTYLYRKPTKPVFHVLDGFELPVLEFVEDMLLAAGIEPLDVPAAGGWALWVSVEGQALGRLYIEFDRSYLYSGAALSGAVVIEGPAGQGGAREFRSTIERPFEILINHGYEAPQNAPFLETLERPGGFIEMLCHAMIDAWGVESVLPSLREPSASVRASVASALGHVGDSAAVPALVDVLLDEHERVRWEAAWSLGRIGDGRAVPDLIAALKDTSQDVRWFASWSLRAITGEDIGPDFDTWSAWWESQGGDVRS